MPKNSRVALDPLIFGQDIITPNAGVAIDSYFEIAKKHNIKYGSNVIKVL